MCKDSVCGFQGANFDLIEAIFARVAQGWSTTLPRSGSRVRIPSRAVMRSPELLVKSGSSVFLLQKVFTCQFRPVFSTIFR